MKLAALRMKLLMDLRQVRVSHVGVYLCRIDTRVAKELLDGTDVGPVIEKIRGK